MSETASAHAASLYAATPSGDPPYPSLAGDVQTDVCIVGGGYTGLSAALHLAERGYSVVLLEGRRIGWGASGRNGGQVHSGQRRDQEDLERIAGREAARMLWDMAEEAKAHLHQRIEQHAVSCDYRPGLIYGLHKASHIGDWQRHIEKLRRDYGYDKVSTLDRDAMRAAVASPYFFGGARDAGGGHLDPLALARGLARAAAAAGAVLHEGTMVTGFEGGEPVRVRTAGGTVSAKQLVLACNGYLGRLSGAVARRVMPLNNFIVATEPLGARAQELIAGGEAVSDTRFVVNYFRIGGDRRLIFGGGETYGYRFPADIASFVRPKMLRIFPQLADARIDFGWGGTLAITPTRLPFIRRIRPNIYNASGFCGHGVAIAPFAGRLVAEAIDGQMSRFDVFARLPVPRFPGGTLLRWPILVSAMTWYGLRDRL
ncbi:MAG: FAD-binding oxidoreductase [Rhodobiaceae bacterium]|nr:FAD-binding oxidoreductase [Rhodobiaceae bacterium]MCC0054919.1 FAD-binding oxidoreductase [Rhodobiaceae bacterium]